MFDRETRKPRGFGFITFDDPEICRRLLSTGQMSTLDEDMQSEYSPMHESGRLYMRGKLIEIKAAQPKEPEQKAAPQSAFLPTKYYQYPSPQYDASYTFGAKYSATLPHANYSPNMYGFTVPPTPIHYSATPSTPVTPQAAMDMAHHMLFYSQLLATPTLISPMMSPMMSPMGMGYNHHYHNYSQEFQANRQHVDFSKEKNGVSEVSASTAPSVSDIKPDSLMTHNPVSSFRIGGATFYPEE